ncbi:amidohydrolase family protein [Celeribacter baekdonensis]|uniref:Amidohydrolase-related domain-containing protein n=1 Tax=Celeribacter baekdonensis TaxID=875171 RepID=A0A2R4LXQ8_9RHOB|nr:amidohydrolase family protein [Celeribacter baekdonensis]AVW89710.1 hypothetical protein DA792_00405 [Celeribacter baekdonensis]
MQITDAQIHLWANDKAPPHHWRKPFRIKDALREMDAAGIAGAVNHPPNWDTDGMEYAAQAAWTHPDRFATLGWFPLDETTNEDAVEALMAQPGMKGMRFILPMPDMSARLKAGKLDWLWAAADARALPMGLFVMPQQIPIVAEIAARFPRMRLLIDHLGVPPSVKLPQAADGRAQHGDRRFPLCQHA